MSWLWREGPDGRRAPGYGVYLGCAVLTVGLVLTLRARFESQAPAPTRSSRQKPSNVSPITRSASLIAPVRDAPSPLPPEARSFRMAPPPAKKAPEKRAKGDKEGFDPIEAALEGEAAPQPGEPGFAALAPAFGLESAKPADKGEKVPSLDYRDPSADGPPPSARSSVPGSPTGREAAVPFLPRGSLICASLLTTVDTSNPSAIVQFGVLRNVVFNRRIQIPAGTRLLGKLAAGRPLRDRINLTADTLLYPDGAEAGLNASAVEADESGEDVRPGVAATCIAPPRWVEMAPYASEIVSGTLGLLESRAERQFSLGIGGVSLQSSGSADLQQPLEQASAQAVQDFTRARLKDFEDRYAQYYLVPAGTDCWLQLNSDFVPAGVRPALSPADLAANPSSHALEAPP